MDWRPAVADDAPLLADLATASSGTTVSPAEAETFLQSWSVEVQRAPRPDLAAAVAVLPPAPGHHRGYGALWSRHEPNTELVAQLIRLATSTPGVRVLQVTSEYPAEVAELQAQGFVEAFPVWTMTHDNETTGTPALPAPLRDARWTEVVGLYAAYEQAYCDQRLVEPHTAEGLDQLVRDGAFAADLSTFALSPDGRLAGFVLAFGNDRGGVELGPIGTVPAWRGRGVSSALFASTLTRCRDSRRAPITLTVDGESPTGAHRLYLRHGFQITSRLIAYHLHLPGQP